MLSYIALEIFGESEVLANLASQVASDVSRITSFSCPLYRSISCAEEIRAGHLCSYQNHVASDVSRIQFHSDNGGQRAGKEVIRLTSDATRLRTALCDLICRSRAVTVAR